MAARKLAVPEVLTIPETAAALKIARSSVYVLIGAGDLQTCDISPTGSPKPKTRVLAESVGEFLRSRTRQT